MFFKVPLTALHLNVAHLGIKWVEMEVHFAGYCHGQPGAGVTCLYSVSYSICGMHLWRIMDFRDTLIHELCDFKSLTGQNSGQHFPGTFVVRQERWGLRAGRRKLNDLDYAWHFIRLMRFSTIIRWRVFVALVLPIKTSGCHIRCSKLGFRTTKESSPAPEDNMLSLVSFQNIRRFISNVIS